MSAFEVRPAGAEAATEERAVILPSPSCADGSTVETQADAWLTHLGLLPRGFVDLFRVAVGAYIADRLTSRGQRFTRDIDLHVQLCSDTWTRDRSIDVVDLLGWLTGDRWTLTTSPERAVQPNLRERIPTNPVEDIMLLSGGLDSFCGAIIAGNAGQHIYVAHHAGNVHQRPQTRTRQWLTGFLGSPINTAALHLKEADGRREASTRSRIFLFLAYAAAVGAAEGAARVLVPENGYTSLNPPLTSARVGALSTRSTHPTTLAAFNHIMWDLPGTHITVVNPHAQLTKGELVSLAAERGDIHDGIAATVTCSKLNGHCYKGGSAFLNCGLCVPCIVRRGAIAVAGLDDPTPYLVDELHSDARERLIRDRQQDITAIERARTSSITLDDIIAIGPYPRGFDSYDAVDLCNRGLRELQHVQLP